MYQEHGILNLGVKNYLPTELLNWYLTSTICSLVSIIKSENPQHSLWKYITHRNPTVLWIINNKMQTNLHYF